MKNLVWYIIKLVVEQKVVVMVDQHDDHHGLLQQVLLELEWMGLEWECVGVRCVGVEYENGNLQLQASTYSSTLFS